MAMSDKFCVIKAATDDINFLAAFGLVVGLGTCLFLIPLSKISLIVPYQLSVNRLWVI